MTRAEVSANIEANKHQKIEAEAKKQQEAYKKKVRKELKEEAKELTQTRSHHEAIPVWTRDCPMLHGLSKTMLQDLIQFYYKSKCTRPCCVLCNLHFFLLNKAICP